MLKKLFASFSYFMLVDKYEYLLELIKNKKKLL